LKLVPATKFTGGNKEEARRFVLQAWALVHGLAMLMLDGQLPADGALIDQIIDANTMWPMR
jgi:hypothetical protein